MKKLSRLLSLLLAALMLLCAVLIYILHKEPATPWLPR